MDETYAEQEKSESDLDESSIMVSSYVTITDLSITIDNSLQDRNTTAQSPLPILWLTSDPVPSAPKCKSISSKKQTFSLRL